MLKFVEFLFVGFSLKMYIFIVLYILFVHNPKCLTIFLCSHHCSSLKLVNDKKLES